LLGGLTLAALPFWAVGAEPVGGNIDLGSDGQLAAEGIAHILEDTPDNRLVLERMARAIERSDRLRRQLISRTSGRELPEVLRELNQLQARLQGQLNRLAALALDRAVSSAQVSAGSFRADVPFARQLVFVVAQNDRRVGWWLQGSLPGLTIDLGRENALAVRELTPPPAEEPSR